MAIKTVKQVREAEKKAVVIEQDARLKRDQTLALAHEEGKKIIASMTNEALQDAEKALENAKKNHQVIMEKAIQEADNEIGMLKEISKNKEQTAIKLVLSKII